MKFSALNVDFSNLSLDPLGSRRPAHAVLKWSTPLKSGPYLGAGGLPSMKMVADRHKHAAYHNKNCRRAF